MNTQYSISKGNENTGCSSPECRSLVRLGEEGNLGNQKEAQLNPFWDYPNERYNFKRCCQHGNSFINQLLFLKLNIIGIRNTKQISIKTKDKNRGMESNTMME